MSRLTRRVRTDVSPMILKMLNLEETPEECIEVVGTDSKTCDEVCEENQCSTCVLSAVFEKLAHYEDLEEQGRLIDWRKTSEEKPDSTRHLIVADGEIISHYGYYLKPQDKWFTNWKCEEEISAPMFWADMPDPPKESLHSECGTKGE